jgi:hypothetical protein
MVGIQVKIKILLATLFLAWTAGVYYYARNDGIEWCKAVCANVFVQHYALYHTEPVENDAT